MIDDLERRDDLDPVHFYMEIRGFNGASDEDERYAAYDAARDMFETNNGSADVDQAAAWLDQRITIKTPFDELRRPKCLRT